MTKTTTATTATTAFNILQRIDMHNISYVDIFGTCAKLESHKQIAENIINAITNEFPNISKLSLKYFSDNKNNLSDIEKLYLYCLPVILY